MTDGSPLNGGAERQQSSRRRPSIRYQLVNGCQKMTKLEWALAVIMTVIPLLGGFLGARFFNNGKYKNGEFEQADWSPSPKVFSPGWSISYILMGIASFLIYKIGSGINHFTIPPLFMYLCTLVCAWLWTPLIFGFGQFAVGEIVLGIGFGLAVGCVLEFGRVSYVAAGLMLPYLAWATFLLVLNCMLIEYNGYSVLNAAAAATKNASSTPTV